MADASAAPADAAVLDTVLEVVRGLAEEVGGPRAARAVAPEASLEREVGLGSLERVELVLRLETALGRTLDERLIEADTPAQLARVAAEAPVSGVPARGSRPSAAPAPLAARAPEAETVHGSLWWHADRHPGRVHVHLREDDGSEHDVTYGELRGTAAAVAGGLADAGVRRGDAVGLMLPTGRDFLAAFQGILFAGAVPVPIYPPVRLDRLEEYAGRQAAILKDAGVVCLITIARAHGVAAVLKGGVPTLRLVTTVAEIAARAPALASADGAGSDPAFIQYTSGSTGAPKGVLLTHANLMANVRAIGLGLDVRPDDVGVSWLPLYHDMGLIGSWLFCLHFGLPLALMSPLAFLARPERWLWTIHQRRATLSPAPNFAYELCARKVPDRALEGLDLSSWRVALNGAEPVARGTLERFTERFAPRGFRPQVMLPVYGLAENSVALCFPPLERGPRFAHVARTPFERDGRAEPAADGDPTSLHFVSVGTPLPRHEVRIVDASGADMGERTVGRLVFRGPSMTSGYFRQPEATAAITVDGGWLDSGDLAFRADGEVHIAGRRKDLIIKGGRNIVPQEVEDVAASVAGIRREGVAAFGVADAESGTEDLVVVAETRVRDPERREALKALVTERVAAAIGLPPDRVALVPPGAVLKTSSGKVRRAATRDAWRDGTLGVSAAGTRTSTRLRVMAGMAAAEARTRLRVLTRLLYAGWVGLLVLTVGIGAWLLVLVSPGRRVAAAVSRRAAALFLRLAGCRLSGEGLETLRGPGARLLAVNHASYVDVLALLALVPADVAFVAKREVLTYPLLKTFVRRAGHPTVERFDATQSVADAGKVADALREGRTVLVFPEGTFTGTPGLRPFRLGAFKTAVETGTPIVPLALRGTRHVLRSGDPLPRPGRIHLRVGTPIRPAGDGWRDMVALRDEVAAAIAPHTGEPRLDIVAAGPERP